MFEKLVCPITRLPLTRGPIGTGNGAVSWLHCKWTAYPEIDGVPVMLAPIPNWALPSDLRVPPELAERFGLVRNIPPLVPDFSYNSEIHHHDFHEPRGSWRGIELMDQRLHLARVNHEFVGKCILDLGAGEGHFARLLLNRGAGEVICLDLERRRFDWVRTEGMEQDHRANRVHWIQGDAYRLPLADRSVDVVFVDTVLHHLPSLGVVVSEIRRVLSAGGDCIALEPNSSSFLMYLSRRRKIKSRNEEQQSMNERHLKVRGVRAIFEDCGFEVKLSAFTRRLRLLRGLYVGTNLVLRARKKTALGAWG